MVLAKRALFLISLLVVTRGASARNSSSEALERYQQGVKYYNVGDFREALRSFKAAYLASPDPAFLFNIGQCYRQLGDAQNAAHEYRAFLRERPHAPNRTAVEHYISEAEAKMHEQKESAAEPAHPATPSTIVPSPTDSAKSAKVPSAASDAPEAHAATRRNWLLPTAIAGAAVGAAALAAGIVLFAYDGQCTDDPVPPATQCHYKTDTFAGGLALTIGGAALVAVSTAAIIVDRLHARAQSASRDHRVVALPVAGPSLFGLALSGSL